MAIFARRKLVEYITVGRDITELKRQQARIAQQSAELQRKNEALNQFTGTVSHDLKAPLRHMSMFSEMIGEDVASGNLDELPVYARHLRQSARRMDQLIDSLLDYAQIADQIGNLADRIDGRRDFRCDPQSRQFHSGGRRQRSSSALPQVKGDPELLKRLCQNLIGNAIKYRRDDIKPVIRIYGETDEDWSGSISRTTASASIRGLPGRFSMCFNVCTGMNRSIRAPVSGWHWQNGSPRATTAPSSLTRHSRTVHVSC